MDNRKIEIKTLLKESFLELNHNPLGYLFITLILFVIYLVPTILNIPYLGSIAVLLLSPGVMLETYYARKEKRRIAPWSIFTQSNGKVMITYIIEFCLIVLWSLLLIIPGIVKGLAYSRSVTITDREENVQGIDAIRQSTREMEWNKATLFFSNLIVGLPVIIALSVLFASQGTVPDIAKYQMSYGLGILICFMSLFVSMIQLAISATLNDLIDEKLNLNDDII